MQDMLGKTVLVTGATSGIGEVAADRLAQKGARIVFIARDRHRGAAMLKHLNAIAGHTEHAAYYADLSVLAEMKRVGEEIAVGEPRIDVLVNNAGAMFPHGTKSADGFEKTFALNHLSYFVLTNLLLDKLKADAPSRIVSTASDAHKSARLDLDALPVSNGGSGWRAYSNSKLMNILFTRELARRIDGSGVTANCLHPGFVASRFGESGGGLMGPVIRLAKNFAITPEQGAETIIYLAASPEVEGVSGQYFYRCRKAEATQAAQNDQAARRLWALSAQVAGMAV